MKSHLAYIHFLTLLSESRKTIRFEANSIISEPECNLLPAVSTEGHLHN